MLWFVGELLRVGRTRLSPSFGGFGALRPAVLRLKALSRGRRLWRARAAYDSSVSGLGRPAVVWGSFLSWLGSDDARGPSLRQQKLDGASKMGTRPGSRLRARSGEASFQTRSRHGTCTWTAWPFSGPVSRVPAGQWPSESQRSLGTTHPSEGVAAKAGDATRDSRTILVTRGDENNPSTPPPPRRGVKDPTSA